MNRKKFVHQNGEGQAWGIVSAEQLWANVYALIYNRPEVRLRKEYEAEIFREVFNEIGLKKSSERVEYQREISLLPDESGTPLLWKTTKELGWDQSQVALFTGEIIRDALDIDPQEKAEDFIQDWLHHDEFTSGLDCIAIGFSGDTACALVVAQINEDTGWSRLSYMGIIPKFRGKDLGKWIHRHGFKMMKDQGGRLYHGGTHSENWPMRKLFESHGCQLFCEMEEWRWIREEVRV